MTRPAEPVRADPHRRNPTAEAGLARLGADFNPYTPPPRRRSRAAFIVLGVVLFLGALATLIYVAHRNHWIDVSVRLAPNTTAQQPIEDMTVIFLAK